MAFQFSSFGQNTNNQQQQPQQQQGSGFAGFSTNNAGTTGGFGSTTNPSFGTGGGTGGGFGGTSSIFGTGGGFGATSTANQPTGFGATTPFSASTAGSSFGSNVATAGSTTGFSGFGSGTTNQTGFGGGGGMFGGNRSAFGGTTTGSGIFGATTGGFGSSNTTQTGAFGAPASTALGGGNLQSEGTGAVPFQPFVEKDSGTTQTNHFQSISFMQPYQKFSFEELRLADYAQGRRYGNASNQAGAFGASTGFGTFGTGTTGGGLFNTTTAGFGSTNQATTNPFGANTGGTGAFGTKPTGSLFGNTANTSAQPTGGIFSTAGTGFGNPPATGFNTAGNNAFGATNTNPSQPSGFNLGGTGQGTGTGFGATNTTGGFGATTGGQQQQQQTGSNPFGGFGQNQQPPAGTSLFSGLGQNTQQQKTGGIFGTTPPATSGGLFANLNANAQPATNPSPFGGGIFGQKPQAQQAGTGTAPASTLFGNPTNNNTAGTGLFGNLNANTQNQQGQVGSLFGTNTQNQPKPGSIFPSILNNPNPGSSILGTNANNQQLGNSIFGGQAQQQQPAIGQPSIFGPSQQTQAQAQQPAGLATSINDIDPYGSIQLFNGLATPTAQNSGPIATPLSSSQNLKKSAILPQYKINPAASTRFVTPQKRGYGFSYSTYGTPGSISSTTSTPMAFGGSLLSGSIGRTLGKSLSTSNLRRTFEGDDSILSPGAFSGSASRQYGSVNLKRLIINRDLRNDLFSSPEMADGLPSIDGDDGDVTQPKPSFKKRVSFDARTVGGNGSTNDNENGSDDGNIFSRANGTMPSAGDQRSSPQINGTANGESRARNGRPEMEQVKGPELAVVHEEDGSPPRPAKFTRPGVRRSRADQKMGDYWMSPSKEELRAMSREQLKQFKGFKVGRHGCGSVEFLAPVDLTTIDLDNIFDNIVNFIIRRCTVYPDETVKPQVGKGLNVPSRIRLENTWPRAHGGREHDFETSGPKYEKHLERLIRVAGTRFEDYDPEKGLWVFTVEHFTTYGIDYEDDSEDGNTVHETTADLPEISTPFARDAHDSRSRETQESNSYYQETSPTSSKDYESSSDPDDTFDFKKKNLLPGAFDEQDQFVGSRQGEAYHSDEHESFFGDRPMGSPSESGAEEPAEMQDQSGVTAQDESVIVEDHDMAGSYPSIDHPMGPEDLSHQTQSPQKGTVTLPPATTRESDDRNQLAQQTPRKLKLHLDGDWMDHLQRTISPKKQDRRALREIQADTLRDIPEDRDLTPQPKSIMGGNDRGFNTSIDLMRSLFGQEMNRKGTKPVKAVSAAKGFEWPYPKGSKTSDLSASFMESKEQEFHESVRPTWGPSNTLVYAMPSSSAMSISMNAMAPEGQGRSMIKHKAALVSEGKDVRFASLYAGNPLTKSLELQKLCTHIDIIDNVPFARMHPDFYFEEFAAAVEGTGPQEAHEKLVWGLASALLDELKHDYPQEASKDALEYLEARVRKDRLSAFWAQLVQNPAMQQAHKAGSKEEEAIAYLSAHQIEDACASLIEGGDFRLATLVAMIGGDKSMRSDMQEQISEWRRLKVLSEISDPIRALYELVAGNTCVCEGSKGALEDRAKTFVISERFRMNWKQAFGLRLWYGIREEEPIQVAVRQYLDDLESNKENDTKPAPWFVEQGVPPMWDDTRLDTREDLLLGILKRFIDVVEQKQRYPFDAIVTPENHQLSPVDYRLAWQLYHSFHAWQFADFPAETVDQDGIEEPSPKIARLTLDFASQLESAGHWVMAVFVVLHLLDTDSRASAAQSLLVQHAGSIGENLEDPSFNTLTQELRIPYEWIWQAKALHARSVEQDYISEVDYLLEAGDWNEAHETLVHMVAPRAVVENDTAMLKRLLYGFDSVAVLTNWNAGGQIFLDYIRLLQLKEQGPGAVADVDAEDQRTRERKGLPNDNDLEAVVRRLLAALPAMMDKERKLSFLEKVAVQEMSGVVAEVMSKRERELRAVAYKSQLLSLPLPGDRYLRHTVDLAVDYYKAIMADGK